MIFFFHFFFTGLAFFGHLALSNVMTTGVPLHALSILTIICVWLGSPRSITYRILPAALLIDIIEPRQLPMAILTVLSVWAVAALIQKRWLTNHSIASLAGIAILGIVVRLTVTWVCIALGAAFGASAISVSATWSWPENLLRLFLESAITIALGVGWRGMQRSFRRSFIYGAH